RGHVGAARRGLRLKAKVGAMASAPQTLFDKVWRAHEVSAESADSPAVLYIDLHLIHEVTSPQAFAVLRERGLSVRRPERTLAAIGALAFGIGTTEVGHVLATQCLLQRKPRTLAVNVSGELRAGVTAKDLILTIIGRLGVSGGTGHVIEYRGDTIRALDMDERMTVCNMSIEAGARAGMIAPDETTYRYLEGRPRAPRGEAWERALEAWRALPTDALARFDREVELDAAAVEPMITYGTNPGMVIPIGGAIPQRSGDAAFTQALAYMGLAPGE